MIKKGIVLLVLYWSSLSSISALNVTSNVAELACDTTTVTFTFADCEFDGLVLLGNNPPSNIIFHIPPQSTPPFLDVMNGELSFDIEVLLTNSVGSFDIDFVVVSSDIDTCADTGDVAIVSQYYNCTPPPPPVNNECSGALPLPISVGSCTVSNFNTISTTASGINPSCDFADWVDLWYSFTANNDTMTLYMQDGPGALAVYTLYDATNGCINLGQELDCDFIPLFSSPDSAEFVDLNIGTNYFLQVSFNAFENGNDQELCLHSTFEETMPCESMVTLSGVVSSAEDTESMDWIASDQQIMSGVSVDYDATDSISLMPDFEVVLGATFQAFIDGCGGAGLKEQDSRLQEN